MISTSPWMLATLSNGQMVTARLAPSGDTASPETTAPGAGVMLSRVSRTERPSAELCSR
jgi:hypothetical protein